MPFTRLSWQAKSAAEVAVSSPPCQPVLVLRYQLDITYRMHHEGCFITSVTLSRRMLAIQTPLAGILCEQLGKLLCLL